MTYEAETFKSNVPPTEEEHIKVSFGIQALHREKATLEARKVTKLHYRDSTSSNDEFSSYAQSIKLIFTTSAIIEVKIDKSLQLQVKRLNIARDTSSIKAWPKIHPKI